MSDSRPRLEKILDLYGQALSEAVGKREPTSAEAQLSDKNLILRFADSDPTDGKSRTQWMIKTYIKDAGFKLEDLGRVHAALIAFKRFKPKLPREQRELSRLKSLQTLEALVDPFVKSEERARLTRDLSSATGREKRRLEELKARDESIIIQEGEGLPTIAVPMTEFASCWWGRGTKWCTAAEKDNAFNHYHKSAPLIVIVCPDGGKFQAYASKNSLQFMDNTDKQVDIETIQARWNEYQPIISWMLKHNGKALKFVPKELRTSKLCQLAIQQNGEAWQYVPKKYRTTELYSLAIEQNGTVLRNIPKHDITPELWRLAIQQDGMQLGLLPIEQSEPKFWQKLETLWKKRPVLGYRTFELCKLAVEQNGKALQFVPEKYRTLELYRLAVQSYGETLTYVPEDERTPELCRLAVEQNGWALACVPDKYKTPELCYLAVQNKGCAIACIPNKQKTPEMFRLAVQQDGQALGTVPKDKRTPELCRIAVEQNGFALVYVPEEYKTYELCRLAVEQNGLALKDALKKDSVSSSEILKLCCLAVQQDKDALQWVPAKYKTSEFLALLPPVQLEWHPDILQGLCPQAEPVYETMMMA
jgi:tetratricopeptide (TPR) repeat protein